MEASGKNIGLVHQAFFINDQAAKIILLLPALLLLIIFLALLNYSEPTASLVPLTSLWDVWRTALSSEGSASRAFLLLNCVIVTIIASSKLEINSSTSCKGAAKEHGAKEGSLEVMMIRGMKGDYIHAERGGRAPLRSSEKSQTCCHDQYNSSTCSHEGNDDHVYDQLEEEDRSKCCCTSSCRKLQAASCHKNDCMTIMEQKSISSMNEERPPAVAACTGRLGGNMSDTVVPTHKISHNYSKLDVFIVRPRDDHLKATSKGRIVCWPRKSFSFNDLAMATAQYYSTGTAQRPPLVGCTNNIFDRPLNHHMQDLAQAPAAVAPPAPSLEEVWAAIISNKTGDDEDQTYMPSVQSSHQRAIKTKYRKNDEIAAPPAANAPTILPAIATAVVAAAAAPTFPATTALEGTEANDPDDEVEELNRRAEEFIARFNQQMRLQRQESLQREGTSPPLH